VFERGFVLQSLETSLSTSCLFFRITELTHSQRLRTLASVIGTKTALSYVCLGTHGFVPESQTQLVPTFSLDRSICHSVTKLTPCQLCHRISSLCFRSTATATNHTQCYLRTLLFYRFTQTTCNSWSSGFHGINIRTIKLCLRDRLWLSSHANDSLRFVFRPGLFHTHRTTRYKRSFARLMANISNDSLRASLDRLTWL
jgi:hypothetical protein